jgi:hypothetical protein
MRRLVALGVPNRLLSETTNRINLWQSSFRDNHLMPIPSSQVFCVSHSKNCIVVVVLQRSRVTRLSDCTFFAMLADYLRLQYFKLAFPNHCFASQGSSASGPAFSRITVWASSHKFLPSSGSLACLLSPPTAPGSPL